MNRSKSFFLASAALGTLSFAALARSPRGGGDNLIPFAPNTPAKASEVNANFNSVMNLARDAEGLAQQALVAAGGASLSVDTLRNAISVLDGNVGIGTTTPEEKLQVGNFSRNEDTFIELRNAGEGLGLQQGLRMRASFTDFGFDIVHDDLNEGLDIRRWDRSFSPSGASALFIDRLSGAVGIGNPLPDINFALDIEDVGAGNSWRGAIAAGGSAGQKVVLGQLNGVATIGGHPGALTAWSTLAINPGGGNVGIGTSSPAERLHVNGNIRLEQSSRIQFGPPDANSDPMFFRRVAFSGGNASAIDLVIGDDPGGAFTNLDFFRIGTESVNGTSYADSFWFRSDGACAKPGGGSWGALSDERLKRNIEPLTDALDRLLQLQGRTFYYADPTAAAAAPGKQIGFVAQQVEQVFPSWVTENLDGYKMVSISGFEALAVEALREQEEKIDSLSSENREQRDEIASLKSRVTQLEAQAAEIASIRTELAALAAR